MPSKLPIGSMTFASARDRGLDYVDKSAFIGKVLRSPSEVTLICRPRRFGKTMNLTMLREFLALPAGDAAGHANLFGDLVIADDAFAMAQRAAHPVLYLSLKDIKAPTFAACLEQVGFELTAAWERLGAATGAATASQKAHFARVGDKTATPADLAQAPKLLTSAMFALCGRPVWVLIDEYDTPLHTAWEHGFYEQAVQFFRAFFGAALKDNEFVVRSVLTGILRVAKEGIFSDLNNVSVDTMLGGPYASDFGFTETEVVDLAADDPRLLGELRHWYNGYSVEGHRLYNPWSVANALARPDQPMQAHWINSGGTRVFERALRMASPTFARDMGLLLAGEAVEVPVVEGIVIPDMERQENMLFTLLVHSGYMTVVAQAQTDAGTLATLKVPNHEVRQALRALYGRLLTQGGNLGREAHAFVTAVLAGDEATVQRTLGKLVLQLLSYHDTAVDNAEPVYHAFVLGLFALLPAGYRPFSNREFGDGRPDVVLLPADPATQPTAVLEFKLANKRESVAAAARRAAAQLVAKRYVDGVAAGGVVYAWAVGFDSKRLAVQRVVAAERVAG